MPEQRADTGRRPRLLDLFCCAGGAADGYAAAGFAVVGVDKDPQPNYPYEFVQADAFNVLHEMVHEGQGRYTLVGLGTAGTRLRFDGVHLSPPCQTRTAYKRRGGGVGEGYEDLIPEMQELCDRLTVPYVIENVPTAPLRGPVTLCGSMFGLDVRRHRLFESNVPLSTPACNHAAQKPGRFPGATNRAPMSRATVEVGVWRIPLETQKKAMGIDREITLHELSQAIPPAYTKHIGEQLMAALALTGPGGRRA